MNYRKDIMIKKKILIFLVVLISLQLVSSHQPRIVYDKIFVHEFVNNPEISQAFYGELDRLPDYYIINSSKEFNLYLNILSPDIDSAKTDFLVRIFSSKDNFIMSQQQEWEKFYEEFGGDSYLKGSEFEKELPAGKYIIEVSNPDNIGRYSLAIGKIERFPLDEAIKSIYTIFKLKHDFFNKSYLAFFEGLIGKAVGILFLILVIIILGVIFFLKKFRKKKKKIIDYIFKSLVLLIL